MQPHGCFYNRALKRGPRIVRVWDILQSQVVTNLFRHITKDPHCHAGAGERVPHDEISVDVQLAADSSNFVL